MADAGLFEDYTFIKYHHFFGDDESFWYTQQDVRTWGYHFIPYFRYHFLEIGKMQGRGFYLGGNLDINQYFRESNIWESLSGEGSRNSYSTSRLGVGMTLGAICRLVDGQPDGGILFRRKKEMKNSRALTGLLLLMALFLLQCDKEEDYEVRNLNHNVIMRRWTAGHAATGMGHLMNMIGQRSQDVNTIPSPAISPFILWTRSVFSNLSGRIAIRPDGLHYPPRFVSY